MTAVGALNESATTACPLKKPFRLLDSASRNWFQFVYCTCSRLVDGDGKTVGHGGRRGREVKALDDRDARGHRATMLVERCRTESMDAKAVYLSDPPDLFPNFLARADADAGDLEMIG